MSARSLVSFPPSPFRDRLIAAGLRPTPESPARGLPLALPLRPVVAARARFPAPGAALSGAPGAGSLHRHEDSMQMRPHLHGILMAMKGPGAGRTGEGSTRRRESRAGGHDRSERQRKRETPRRRLGRRAQTRGDQAISERRRRKRDEGPCGHGPSIKCRRPRVSGPAGVQLRNGIIQFQRVLSICFCNFIFKHFARIPGMVEIAEGF